MHCKYQGIMYLACPMYLFQTKSKYNTLGRIDCSECVLVQTRLVIKLCPSWMRAWVSENDFANGSSIQHQHPEMRLKCAHGKWNGREWDVGDRKRDFVWEKREPNPFLSFVPPFQFFSFLCLSPFFGVSKIELWNSCFFIIKKKQQSSKYQTILTFLTS